jgi:hypothetical protein
MNYSSISIQGNLISSEILEKIRTEDIRFQKATEFNLSSSASVRDEINLAWSLAVSNWIAFKQKRELLSDNESGTTETRRYWILPLLSILGYEISASNAEIINDKSYAISHRANNLNNYPIHIVGVNQSLDKRPETGGTRLSPHALVQEYVNNTEHLYGMVSNGRFLRLLRDATRLSRLSYLEFDLEQMMDEGLFVEFALLYRSLHASRMPSIMDNGAESIIEFYHQEAIASGSRIRERLSLAVESSIKELANGLLHHSENEELRQIVLANKITPKEYYLFTLRLVYRMLFLLVIEERKLIYPDKRDEDLNKKRSIYYDYYSIQRLTKLAVKSVYVDPRKTDLWHSLLATFALFEKETVGRNLGIAPLGSGLFAPDALGIINGQMLNNECLLKVIRYLVTFTNENNQLVRVNYADLDVEEFGSVYEGLLEYDPIFTDNMGQPIFSFIEGNSRSSSGSHYTPEELVKPLITHSLDYLIADKLKEPDPEAALLSLTICDVACGSGHILLSAARRVGYELAKYRTKEDQPTPTAMRLATRDVIKNCIYGVDLNPLAIELCKVALWLEAHQPGEPLNFLDHHIKCGNAIVGLAHQNELENGIATEAFKALSSEEKESKIISNDARVVEVTFASSLAKRNKQERAEREDNATQVKADLENATQSSVKETLAEYINFNKLPENTPDEIERKAKIYKKFIEGKGVSFLKTMADTQVAQYFIPKTLENKDKIITDSEYRQILSGYRGWQGQKTAYATIIALEQKIFHWFIEFPEVFSNGGFDCILGNPPYLGGTKISTNYGIHFSYYLLSSFSNTSGLADLVTYFIKRNTSLLKSNAFFNIITTDSVSQGATRLSALEELVNNGSIIFAIKTMRWPGTAAVNVALLGFFKGKWKKELFLNGRKVEFVNSLLGESDEDNNTNELFVNHNKSYTGSKVYGEGFVLTKEKANKLLSLDSKNQKVIKPYLTGDDIANEIGAAPSRFVINFQGWPLDRYSKNEWLELSAVLKNEINDRVFNNKPILNAPHWYGDSCARDFPAVLEIIEKDVKPEREKVKGDVNAQKYWWIYQRVRKEMYDAVSLNKNIIVIAQTAKYILPTFTTNDKVHSVKVIVFTDESRTQFALLANSLYNEWCWKFGTTMGSSTLQYSTSQCFDSYPFPQKLISKLETIGEAYHEHRGQLMLGMQLGLTKTYNLFHNNGITKQAINEKDKQVNALQKHLEKTADTISFDEALKGILKLRELHVQMDEAVLDAYGWNDIALKHDFYEVDYLPENDRVRFTIHPDARKEVLKRLLELNHKVYEEEIKQGLHKDEDVRKFYEQKGIEIPAEVLLVMRTKKPKAKKKLNVTNEPETGYGQLL